MQGTANVDAPPVKTPAARQRHVRLPTTSGRWALVLLAPSLILLALFQWAPIGIVIYNSFREFSLLGDATGWAGPSNYLEVIGSAEFRSSLVLMLVFMAVKLVVQTAVGIGAALLVLRSNRFTSLVRSVVFLPTATAMVAVALMFSFLFDREIGLIDALFEAVGLARVPWLLQPQAAQFVMLLLSIWRDTGFVMLVFLSGLQAVPATLLDAARVDGASLWQEIRYVTLPLLIRSFQFAAIFTTLACVKFIAPIDLMTQGGPRQSTDIASYHIYQQAFSYFNWGQTSAMSVLLLLLLLVITLALMSALRARWEY